MAFGLFITSVVFGALNTGLMFTPEMIDHMKKSNSFFDLNDGLESGKIDPRALLQVASEIENKLFAAQEANDATLCGGKISFMPTASMASFRIGTGTCDFSSYIFGLGGTVSVNTKNLLIATAVVVALTVAYKKGYFGKIKNYFMKSSDQNEDEHAV